MMNNFSIKYYPVVAEPEDHRNHFYENKNSNLKEEVNLRPFSSKVRNQVNLRSCSSEAVVGAYEILLKKEFPEQFVNLSPLFVHHNAKMYESRRPVLEAGVYIRDAIRSVKHFGICSEDIWPYSQQNFSFHPTEESYNDAKKRKLKHYFRLKNFDDLLDALTNELPVISAIKTFSNFTQFGWNGTSYLDIPGQKDFMIGGHAVTVIGYNQNKEYLIAKNSFGPLWGDAGYFYISFDYARSHFLDSWTIGIDLQN